MGEETDGIQRVEFPDDLVSEDSSFYGDEDVKALYEKRAASFNPRELWEIHEWNLQCIITQEKAAVSQPTVFKRKRDETPAKSERESKVAKVKSDSQSPSNNNPQSTTTSSEPFNPYADYATAYQLHETITNFLTRLPPSTTTVESSPWIWIANPHSPSHLLDSDIGGFKQSGLALLDSFLSRRGELEAQHPDKGAGLITRLLKSEREQLEADIVSLAKQKNVMCGKWMLFPLPSDVDAVWATVAKGTLEGRLGCAAKVATADDASKKPERLICIYTEDFSDVADVKRVLAEMRELGLVKDHAGGRAVYYKCDAYTYLDIMSGNEYKLKASMYSSRDLFKEMAKKNKK